MPTIPSKGSARDAASLVSDPAANDSLEMHSAMGHDEIVKPRLY